MATLEAVRMQEGDPAGQDAAAYDFAGKKIQAVGLTDPDTGAYVPIATEQTLLEINDKLPGLSEGNVPVADSNLYALTETLRDLASILAMFGAMRGADGALRVNALTGSTVAVSSLPTLAALTTLSNQTSLGGYQAANLVQAQMNFCAQQSNIVNMVG